MAVNRGEHVCGSNFVILQPRENTAIGRTRNRLKNYGGVLLSKSGASVLQKRARQGILAFWTRSKDSDTTKTQLNYWISSRWSTWHGLMARSARRNAIASS